LGGLLMRILAKFNLILILIFAAAVAITGNIAHGFLERDARQEVIQQAELMVGAAGGMRTYTAEQLDPLLEPSEQHASRFIPQTIPFYSATEVFNYLRKTYPAYTYKEAALNPTNPRDRATDWEADIIQNFGNHPNQTQTIGERATPQGESLFLAHPIKVEANCLSCHSEPSVAPRALLAEYGRDNGFNWKVGDVVGAQIVSVPTAMPEAVAAREFKALMISLGSVFLATLLLLDLALVIVVIRPVSKLSATAEEISKGNLEVPEISASGSDEIAQLARSFNRMYVSLAKAIKMLEAE
jgi:protein-histidine pros-kinase